MTPSLLGAAIPCIAVFQDIDVLFSPLRTKEFEKSTRRHKFKLINKTLLESILRVKGPCFLLPAVIRFIEQVEKEQLINEPYTINSFEFWLNHFSNISPEEKMVVRGRIVGKLLPRELYQEFFPIGMNKHLKGSHLVIAHFSPDVDTTVASLFGWIDAFGAKVSEGTHQWRLPSNFSDPHMRMFLEEVFSQGLFRLVAKIAPRMTLTAQDLVSQKDVLKINGKKQLHTLETEHYHKALIVTDNEGHFIGDAKSTDSEAIRQLIIIFNGFLTWFSQKISIDLITLFSKKVVERTDIKDLIEGFFNIQIKDIEPAKQLNERQKKYQNDYLKRILRVKRGLQASFLELVQGIEAATGAPFSSFTKELNAVIEEGLFSQQGLFSEDRPELFTHLKNILSTITVARSSFDAYIDRLDVRIMIRKEVFGLSPSFVRIDSDIEEIRSKIDTSDYITVVIEEGNKVYFPIGVIRLHDLNKAVLGTVSLRDFSNTDETNLASYLEIVSIIDHHKIDVATTSAPLVLIADAQSANTLIAERTLRINEQYSTLGIDDTVLEQSINEINFEEKSLSTISHLQKLLQLKCTLQKKGSYFVDPQREFIEYLSFIYAILDDTDLLSKVSDRDVLCVAELLNRMKSLSIGRYSPVVSLEDIPRDTKFATRAATRLLQNEDLFSIYEKVYAFKEEEVSKSILQVSKQEPSLFFSDTKEMNGCCRVGQSKLFKNNFELFRSLRKSLQKAWYLTAQHAHEENPQIDFHMQMISTIPSSLDMYQGTAGQYTHSDEIWFWLPPTKQALDRLIVFLNNFQATEACEKNPMHVTFIGENAQELDQIFAQNFPKASRETKIDEKESLPLAILSFPASLLNSRKAVITPSLPKYIP